MDEVIDARMTEANGAATADMPEMNRVGDDSSATDVEMLTGAFDNVAVSTDMDGTQPGCSTQRTAAGAVAIDTDQSTTVPADSRPADQTYGTSAAPEQPPGQP